MAGNGGPGDKCSFHAPPSPLVSRRPASEGTPWLQDNWRVLERGTWDLVRLGVAMGGC